MSSIDYGQCRSLPDLAVRYQFDLTFTRRPAGVIIPSDMSLRCIGSTIPSRSDNEVDELYIHGHNISQPGLEDTSGTIDLTLFETVDMAVFNLIRSWRELNRANETGVQAPRSQTTGDLRLKLLNRQKQPVYIYDLRDCWIVSDDKGSVDGTQRTGKMDDIGITLRYDHFEEGPA